ncbi:MAG: hypothetical protein ACI9LN_002954, partial [Saprospiraceae bacterium]
FKIFPYFKSTGLGQRKFGSLEVWKLRNFLDKRPYLFQLNDHTHKNLQNMKSTTFTTLIFLLSILSCSSPQKKFTEGDYPAAFKSALKNLKNDKKATDADRDILLRALDKIYLAEGKEISFYENSAGLDNLEKAFKINKALLDKIEKANPYLGDKFAFNYQQSVEQEQILRGELIDGFLQFGAEDLDASIDNGNKFLAQDAFKKFRKAEKYGAAKTGLDSLYQLCYEYGTIVYRVSANTSFNISYNWKIDRMFENVRSNHNFMTIFYERNTDNIDCDIEISFRSLSFNESETTNTQNFEEAVVTGYETVTDTSGFTSQREIRTNIKGKVETTTITKKAQWRVDVSIKGYSNNCRLSGSSWCLGTESKEEEVELSGDLRAIPETYRPSAASNLASDSDMAEDLIEDIYNQFRREYF